MIRTSSLAALLLAPLAVDEARAQEKAPAAAVRRLSLDEVLRMAQRNNLDLKAARARLDQAAFGVSQAWVSLLPTLAAQGKYTHNYKQVLFDPAAGASITDAQATWVADSFADLYGQTGKTPSQLVQGDLKRLSDLVSAAPRSSPIIIQKSEQLDASLTATVPLIVPWAWLQLGSARKTSAAAESTFEVSRTTVMVAVAQAFFVAAGTDEVFGARRHAVDVAHRTVEDARAKVNAGTANRVETTRAQVAYERAVQTAEEADVSRIQAYRALATATGIGEAFVVDPGTLPPERFGPAEDVELLALKLRPEFAQAERTIAANSAAARASRWRWSPTLSGFGNLRAFNYPGFSGDQYAWAVGLQLDWALYDGGLRDAQRRLALAQNAEQLALVDKLRLTVRDDIDNARRNVGLRRHAVDTAAHAVALSRETLDLVRVQHDAGTSTQLDLLTAQDQLVAAELQLAQARFDLALADITLQRNVGVFPAAAPPSDR